MNQQEKERERERERERKGGGGGGGGVGERKDAWLHVVKWFTNQKCSDHDFFCCLS